MKISTSFKSFKKSVPDGIVNLIEVCGIPQQKEEAKFVQKMYGQPAEAENLAI